jgi:hypothetical protein
MTPAEFAFRFVIYQMAVKVLDAGGLEDRRRALEAVPPEHHQAVENEARRVFEYRRQRRSK